MAETETKRIIELTEASTVQSGDFIAVDSNARGTKKVSTDTLATSAALTAETNARAGADEQMSERMDGIEEQTALIQNPTKTLSGALCSFTDGADMPMVACTAEIVPKQSGTGTPSPDNVRPISGWTEVNVIVSPTQEATDGTTTTTPLGRTVYGGSLDVVSGVLTVTHGYMKYTNISTTSGAAVTGGWRCNFLCPDDDINKRKWSIQSAPTLSMFDISKPLNEGGISKGYAADSYTVIVPNATSKETADATLEGLELVYELATPQTYQLTPTEIQTILGENNVWADSGDVEITYRRDISIVINNLESALNG